jgi:hypothetical protein
VSPRVRERRAGDGAGHRHGWRRSGKTGDECVDLGAVGAAREEVIVRSCRAPLRDEEHDPAGGEGEHALLRRETPDRRRRAGDRLERPGVRRVDDQVACSEGHVRDAPARQPSEDERRRRGTHRRHDERKAHQHVRGQREARPGAERQREHEDTERQQVDEVRPRVELERGHDGEHRRGEECGVAIAAELGERAPEGERHERARRLLGTEAERRQRRPRPRGSGGDRECERRHPERPRAPPARGERGQTDRRRHARRPRERERVERRHTRADLAR